MKTTFLAPLWWFCVVCCVPSLAASAKPWSGGPLVVVTPEGKCLKAAAISKELVPLLDRQEDFSTSEVNVNVSGGVGAAPFDVEVVAWADSDETLRRTFKINQAECQTGGRLIARMVKDAVTPLGEEDDDEPAGSQPTRKAAPRGGASRNAPEEKAAEDQGTPDGCVFSWLCYLPPQELPEPLEKSKIILWIAAAIFPPAAAALAPSDAGVKMEGPVLRASLFWAAAMWVPVLLVPVVFLAILIPFYTFILTIPAMIFYMAWGVFAALNFALVSLWFGPVNMLHVMGRNAHPVPHSGRAAKQTAAGVPAPEDAPLNGPAGVSASSP